MQEVEDVKPPRRYPEEPMDFFAEDLVIRNTPGSSAGAGSGQFHQYRLQRRREAFRLAQMREENAKEKEQRIWEAKKNLRVAEEVKKKASKTKKRHKRKAKEKEAKGRSKAERDAKRQKTGAAPGEEKGSPAQESSSEPTVETGEEAKAAMDSDNSELSDTEKELSNMVNAFQQFRIAKDDEKIALGIKVNNLFNSFFGRYLLHMQEEEEEWLPLFWKHLSEEEILEMERKSMAGFPDEMKIQRLPLIFSVINPFERATYLNVVNKNVSLVTYKAIMEGIAKVLSVEDLQLLQSMSPNLTKI